MKFSIYHPSDGSINHERKTNIEFTLVYTLICDSFEDAWRRCQNDCSASYAKIGIRSTSVGDVIQDASSYRMVEGIGFKEVPMIQKAEILV